MLLAYKGHTLLVCNNGHTVRLAELARMDECHGYYGYQIYLETPDKRIGFSKLMSVRAS